jgi:RimJ/RimL family protein N-acetyltransferase
VSADLQSRDELVAAVSTVLHSLSPEDLRLRFGNAGGIDWLLGALQTDEAHHAYVARDGDVPVGVVDLAPDGDALEFGVAVAPSYRQRGIAHALVREMIDREVDERHAPQRFIALCLPENRIVAAMLRSAGFSLTGRWSEYLRFELETG